MTADPKHNAVRQVPRVSPNTTAHPAVLALANERVRMQISQHELSLLSDYPQPSIQNWERGDRSPNITKFMDMATSLGVSITLINREGQIIFTTEPDPEVTR